MGGGTILEGHDNEGDEKDGSLTPLNLQDAACVCGSTTFHHFLISQSSFPSSHPYPSKPSALELDDPYFWLRDDTRKNPEVLSLIKEENQYTEAWTRHSKHFQQRIYNDLLRHMKQTDASMPYPWEGNYYYSRTAEGKSYSYICRRRGSMDAVEETILDLNALAKGEKYLDVGQWSPAPGAQTLLAYSVDTTGYEVGGECER